MKTFLFIILSFTSLSAFAALNTEISCELKREEWEKMTFKLRFLTNKRVVTGFTFKKDGVSGVKGLTVSAIHQSSEARYVGVNFLNEEKLVFIFLTPIFETENLEIPWDIEAVSSIYGPINMKCKAIK